MMSDKELMILLKQHPQIASRLVDMTKLKAKELYVDSHHDQTISQLHSENKYNNGRWCTHIYVDGKRKAVGRTTRDELYNFLYDFYKEQEEPPKTFDNVFDMLIESKRAQGRSEATIKEYQRYKGFIPQIIRDKAIYNITEDELRLWLINDYLKRKPKKEALKKMIQLIKAVFDYGIRKKQCYENPAQVIKSDDYFKFCDLSGKTNEDRSFSEQEIDMLRKYCLEHCQNPHSAVILVAMETGMRTGELTALRKEDIQDGFIHVHRQQIKIPKTDVNDCIRFTEVNYTKNERANPKGGRLIPITKLCQQALDIAFQLEGDSEYVFHHPNGNRVLNDSYEYYLRRVCKRLGITTTHNHAFRVAFNSRLIEAGMTCNDRCLILGHSMQTNERHYSFSDKRRAENIKNMLKSFETGL